MEEKMKEKEGEVVKKEIDNKNGQTECISESEKNNEKENYESNKIINCYEKCETCDSLGNSTNMNCLSCKTDFILIGGNCIEICLNNGPITPNGECLSTCPNGTYQFSLNNSCLESCPHNYIISNNKCLFKSFDKNTTVNEFKNQIRNDITSYVNSTKVINGSNFQAVIIFSDDIDPEKQLKNGISSFDLGNCTNVLKEYLKTQKYSILLIYLIQYSIFLYTLLPPEKFIFLFERHN